MKVFENVDLPVRVAATTDKLSYATLALLLVSLFGFFVRHRIFQIKLLACALLLYPGSVINALAFSWTTSQESYARQLIQNCSLTQNTAISIAVGINGTLVFSTGFPIPDASAESAYPIGSVSKQFLSAAILKLIEEQRPVPFTGQPIQLSTSINDFFVDVTQWKQADGQPLILANLLTMTSGIPNFMSVPLGLPPDAPVQWWNLLPRLKTLHQHILTNGQFDYSNTNYFLLAQIVELMTATGGVAGDYRAYLGNQIFQKAGMSKSGFIDSALPPGGLMPPGIVAIPRTFYLPDWPKGAGGIWSTVIDLHKWNTALFTGSILSSSSLATMLAPAVVIDGLGQGSYAMGWFVRQRSGAIQYDHSGAISGYSSFNMVVRRTDNSEFMSISILTNRDGVQGLDALAQNIVQSAW